MRKISTNVGKKTDTKNPVVLPRPAKILLRISVEI